MRNGSSEQVRAVALEKYLEPALRAGKKKFAVAVKDVLQDLVAQGFPPGNTPQVCSALRKGAFLREHGIEIESIEGPPSKMSTTVVFHYRTCSSGRQESMVEDHAEDAQRNRNQEDPTARSRRLTEGLRGLLKDEFAAYGGGEAFLKWVRSEDENAA
jgi:hypothetical protein